MLELKAASDCRFDVLALGEVMIRLDPGEGRIRSSRQFQAWEGGGEYNVARGLRRCFGMRSAIVTGIARNEIGYLLEDLILQGGVDTSLVKWFDYDGIGREVRNGLNFVERGFGIRGAVGCSDRGHSATSKIQPGDIDWDTIFGELGVRWLHTGGVYAALSDASYEVTLEAIRAAKKHGTIVSYDLNYRESLWQKRGGLEQCKKVNRDIASLVDVMLGFPGLLGIEPPVQDRPDLSIDEVEQMVSAAVNQFPNLKVFSSTVRQVTSASQNDWSAFCWADGVFHRADGIQGLEILDRVGGGDSFGAGLIYGLLEKNDVQAAVAYGNAHGALAMTTPGDNSMASLSEVESIMAGGAGRTAR